MNGLRRLMDRLGARFERDGRKTALYPLYEAGDTFLFTPASTAERAAHVRDGLDLKRMMVIVVIGLVPATLMAMYNTGLQAHRLIEGGGTALDTWQSALFAMTGLPLSSGSVVACLVHGAIYFLPILIVTYATGGIIEVGSAILRGHEVNEGFFVTGLLIPLTLPATIPLWQVAMGTAFGVIIGKEIFGGTGMNFLNPALVARAFLFFAYPAAISGDVWIAALPADGVSSSTWLASLAESGAPLANATWWDAFWGFVPGSMGETSVAASLFGAFLLIVTGIGSWRTMVAVVGGTFVTAMLLNTIGSDTNPMMNVPFHWHIVLGGLAFGLVFMATDPVSSAFTDTGRWVYGFFIGVLTVLIRCVNPAYPEGVMLAILFMNMFAPLIDHFVVEANKKRRRARYANA